MKKLNVLLVTFEFSNKSCGGAGVYAFELAKTLSENGIKMCVIAPNPIETKKEVISDNLIIYWQKTIFKPFMRRPIFFNSIRKNYKKIIKEEKIDIIHSNDYAGLLLIGKLPSITTIHHPRSCEIYALRFQNIMNLIAQIMEKRVLKKSDKIIAVSHLTYDLMVLKNPWLTYKTKIILEGVDINKFKRVKSDIRKKYHMRDGEIVLFAPGCARLKRKGSETLFKALSKLKEEYNIKCIITGKSTETGWVKQFNESIKLFGIKNNLVLTGEVDYDELPKYYSASDIVVFPSLFEGFGIPVLESMSCGKPIIATETGEAPYIIKKLKNGLLVKPRDDAALYKKIKFLIENKALRNKFGDNGRKLVEKEYSLNKVAVNVRKIYEELIK